MVQPHAIAIFLRMLGAAAPLIDWPAASAAQGPQPLQPGIFSNVELSPETGDLGGLEVEIRLDETGPYVLVVVCEGWCNTVYRSPLKPAGARFEFSFRELSCDPEGVQFEGPLVRFHIWRSGSKLVVEDQAMPGYGRWRLRPLKRRFGLNVASPASSSLCAPSMLRE